MNLNIHKITTEAFACIADIGSGRHNTGTRGTSELSANILGPLAAIMRDFDWDSPRSFSDSRKKLEILFNQYPDVLGCYPALKEFALNEPTQFQ
ncbi:MAG: hypothetical protein ACRBCL_17245 [Maritimibacter sp.]